MSESPEVILARIEERLKMSTDANEKVHVLIVSKIDELTGRVNHEITLLDGRVCKVEDDLKDEKSRYAGRMQLIKWLSVAAGVGLSLYAVYQIIMDVITVL